MNTTLVIGAAASPDKYSYKAVSRLREKGYKVIAYGKNTGSIADVEIETDWNPDWLVDTVTLYINPWVQEDYQDQIIALKPRRVLFNPGTENEEFIRRLQENGISGEMVCTLVMLATGVY